MGLFDLKWKGTWSPAGCKRITDSLDRIASKLDDLDDQLLNEMQSLPECERDELMQDLSNLHAVFLKMLSGITSQKETLKVYHYNFGGPWSGALARAWNGTLRVPSEDAVRADWSASDGSRVA